MSFIFPPEYRLRTREDFSRLRQAKRFQCQGLVCVYQINQLDHGRLGMAVSTKFGHSAHRHQLKRYMREVFRQHPVRNISIDILLIPRITARDMSDPSCRLLALFNQLSQKFNHHD
ncbi:MAG: ribonuclease P protein component [Zetaproteobacteria bacterium CG_4_9_14_3_um_filter_49_83]|nr:MAG: ribonuclease P protein component [Zetaproteobacteria bacterium CG17_big_fil_post_rev_8_21_14_2_50_50_13]PIV31033.1 MAG: ribonuclease P protein component [Zetaproteobacteria bacterium CG02_land_8_20_14_3_00_50_9]PIY55216.1 MAG: ribonuclease P protein component [Zetaproteobacteria bacterium CG_4_10_14_0_8_um_filter_49_80]PJA36220.1 MAG: ribonuclease P protein component [Zetaproteobacteria bacterium CG_4_9_14_3_um_filter_49_83]